MSAAHIAAWTILGLCAVVVGVLFYVLYQSGKREESGDD